MSPDSNSLSWREQLTQARERVAELEKQREQEKRLQRERNEQALTVRLKTDTAEALSNRFAELKKLLDRAVRRFYPLPEIEAGLTGVGEFGNLLRFYTDCMKPFAKVFSAQHKSAIPALLTEMGALQTGLDRQLEKWREVKEVLDKTAFRLRRPADNEALVTVAKSFSERAHSVPLSVPGDYFAHEKENFWVAETEGLVVAHFKFHPADKVLAFSIAPPESVNFNKCVRGILNKFCLEGPLPQPLPTIRVRVGYVREVKFYTDMGFVRAETKGPSDWIYQRDLAA